MKVRTDLMADPTLWDESVPGYRRTTKLGKGGTKAFNDKLQDIFRLIEADFTPMRDGKWLKETINGYLHPVAEQPKSLLPLPCEDNEKDTTLENLDKGTVPDWFMKYVKRCNVSHGRKACYYSTIKKLRRYELFKREFEGQKDFNLYPDTFTIDDLYDFYEYVENSSVNIYDDNNDSAFFNTEAVAELASNVAATAVELAVGPAVVPTSGGGGGGSSSGWGDDDDDDEKKRRNRPKFHR